jgi:PIN domain nuclease of toxin-antitoxin system
MRFLLDTHALLWRVEDSELLSLVSVDASFDRYGVARVW